MPRTIWPRSPGRPLVYDEATFPDLAYKFCLLGATNRELATAFGVKESTIEHWCRHYDDFFRRVQEGRTIADANVAHGLYKRAAGYIRKRDVAQTDRQTGMVTVITIEEEVDPDPRAAQFWLSNRRKRSDDPWRDVVRTELTGADGAPIEITDRDERAKARLQKLLSALPEDTDE